jgi:hypothetical protein
MRLNRLALSIGLALGLFCAHTAIAADIVVDLPELVVTRSDTGETCALPGTGYGDVVIGEESATLTVTGYELPAGQKRVAGHGIRRVSWQPREGETAVTIEFAQPPTYSVVNAVAGTEHRQQTPQVIVGFGFDSTGGERRTSPVLGSRRPGEQVEEPDQHGDYEMPDFPPVRYSDALVTLRVENVDFRDVLWLMSEIGGVSIVLDPYWADEPTGGPRAPGGGADPDGGGGSGGGEPGFRPGGGFIPGIPRSGTGNLTLNFDNVPFDQALDLILMSVGLYKIDIHPGSFG